MDNVYEELDEAKAEIEKLRADLKGKADLSENLKKAYNEQVLKIQEASSRIEEKTQEINEREAEVSMLKQRCEDLQCSLNEKESIVRCISSANDKLRIDCDEKRRRWEEEQRGLVLALDEANEKNMDQEQKIHVLMADNEGLKGLLSASQKKCLEAEKKAKAPKELRQRDDMLFKLEEEKRKVEDQLKWKKEQFTHLEEAHANLQGQFIESKKEWEKENNTLIDKICSLQTSLDSQTRISEDLQNQLKMCNQALAHEESRRKYLEVEVSEFKMRFDTVFTEHEEAKSQIECLTAQRDEEIATLRHALVTKETFCKEFEYQLGKLEQENQELLASLKELQEARIQEVGNSSSLAKLRSKLRFVEQMHRDCCADLKAKEAAWSSQLEKLHGELYDCKSVLEGREQVVKELEIELANCHYEILQLRMQNEEASIMLLVLISGMTEAQFNRRNAETEMSLVDKERENVALLMKQLEVKNTALDKAQIDLNEERHKAESLLKRVESLEVIEEQRLLVQKELDRYKEMLEELSRHQLNSKQQTLQTENDLKVKLRAACDALDIAKSELVEEHEKVASLSRRVESLILIEEKQLLMQREIESYKEMLKESSKHQRHLEEKLREACYALDMTNSELSEQHEKEASLSMRVESLELVEEQLLQTQKELEKYKRMLEESSNKQVLLKEKALHMETELKKKLSEAGDAMDSAKSELEEERERAACLSRRVESFVYLEEQHLQMQRELQRSREMLEESSKFQVQLKKQALQKENHSRQEIQKAREALDAVNSELAAKLCENHAVEFELWIWKSIVEHLKDNIEENQALRKELEASLLAQIEVGETVKREKDDLALVLEAKNSRIDKLQQQIALFEQELKTRDLDATTSARIETTASFESEKEGLLKMKREKEKILERLQREFGWLEQESLSREIEVAVFAQMGAEGKFELEKECLIQLMEEKDQRIDDLLKLVNTTEQKFNSSLISFAAQLGEKQAEISLVHEAWEKIVAAEIMALLEIEEKKLMIVELEEVIGSTQKKLESEEKSSYFLKQQAVDIEAKLEGRLLEMKNLLNAMETKLGTSEALVDELKNEKRNMIVDVMKMSSEREQLLGLIMGVADRIGQLSSEDVQLLSALERILSLEGDTEPFDSLKENMTTYPSPSTTKPQVILKDRSPFRELN